MLGFAAGALGAWLVEWRDTLTFVLGVLIILLGLVFAGWLPLLPARVAGALGPGGRAWRRRRCSASSSASAGRRASARPWPPSPRSRSTRPPPSGARCSGGVYAVGLGIPFIVAALLYRRALGAFGWVRRHQVWVMRLGGLMLVAVGVLLVTGWWDEMVTWLQVHLILGTETPV